MEAYHFVWMLAALTGLVAAGLTGSGWAMATGRLPHLWLLAEYSAATPLRAVAVMIYAPLGLARAGLATFGQNPLLAALLVAFGTVWSFLQGVFILTAIFGFT